MLKGRVAARREDRIEISSGCWKIGRWRRDGTGTEVVVEEVGTDGRTLESRILCFGRIAFMRVKDEQPARWSVGRTGKHH
jgi:hypothetical protein